MGAERNTLLSTEKGYRRGWKKGMMGVESANGSFPKEKLPRSGLEKVQNPPEKWWGK